MLIIHKKFTPLVKMTEAESMNTIAQNTLLTPKELSERWDGIVSTATLANWRAKLSSKLPFIKIGGSVFYQVRDIEAYEKETFDKMKKKRKV